MNPIIRNILAVIAGIIVGGLVNYGLVLLGHQIVAPPAGMDPMDPESMREHMANMTGKHFLFPFLAHALGTLTGAFTCVKLAASRHKTLAFIIGFFYLLGGITAVMMIQAPMWMNVLDLTVAYIPMAWLGWKLGKG